MRFPTIAAASLILGFAASGHAQPQDRASFTHGESKRCESLTGAAKDQCDKEEATKTQGQAAQDLSSPSAKSASGGTSFTHGESARCESLSGAEKEQCDDEEATKAQETRGRFEAD
jgi:hypothetical protein